jgi:dihydrofolate synthase/folylpolyglutamate synthase
MPDGYRDALEWLYAQSRGGKARDPARMRRLTHALHLTFPPSSFHVVGTNGKGSVTAMIAAAYTAAGIRSGRFISPHVEDFRERISVDGADIAPEEVTGFAQRVASLGLESAFFELTFTLALEHFAHKQVAVAAVEAGVGAKNDATIVLENVRATVITNVGRDHLKTLGPTLADIARDKAEAVRPGVPVITGASGEALEIIRRIAAKRHSPIFVDTPGSPLFALPAKLAAGHAANLIRWRNQRLAAAALRVVEEVSDAAILTGLQAQLPARAETFTVSGRKVLLDGAHNPSAARALKELLDEPYVLLFGALPRKLGEETLAVLEPDTLITVIAQADEKPSTLACTPARIFIGNPLAALNYALRSCPPGACVLITGSLHLAGRVRPYLRSLSMQAASPEAAG